MDIGTKKLELIEWLIRLKDNSLIDYLNSLKESESSTSDWWDDLSIDQIESINRGLKDVDEGRIHSHESVMKKYDKYF
jgi:predicted transcriptional regulator